MRGAVACMLSGAALDKKAAGQLRRKASATEKKGRVAQTPASVGDAARAADAAANRVNPAHPARR